jgi:hypothetical protein
MNQAPTEDKSNPHKESFTRYKREFDESSPYNNESYEGLTPGDDYFVCNSASLFLAFSTSAIPGSASFHKERNFS